MRLLVSCGRGSGFHSSIAATANPSPAPQTGALLFGPLGNAESQPPRNRVITTEKKALSNPNNTQLDSNYGTRGIVNPYTSQRRAIIMRSVLVLLIGVLAIS
jgi:hypothetical protein